jgi:hypothetical protein
MTQHFMTVSLLAWATLLLVWLSTPARASAALPSPAPRDVCVDGTVDKEKLGFALLDMYGVTRAFEGSLPPNPTAPFNAMPVWQRVLAEDPLCPLGGTCPDNFKTRFQKDIKAAGAAQQHLLSLLRGDQRVYTNPTGIQEPVAYLTDPNNKLVCLAEQPGAPAGQQSTASAIEKLTNPLRIRGSTDGLFFGRERSQFKSVDSAVIGFNNDDIKQTRTDKLVAVIGYAFDFELAPSATYELIPYVGTNRNVTKKNGKPSVTSTETVDFGLLNGLYKSVRFGDLLSGWEFGNWFTLRPDYLLDLQDNSRLFSLNAGYTPVVNGIINDYIRLVPGRDDFFWFRLIFDMRLDGGVYTDRGTVDPGNRRDYARLGTQFGIALTSDIKYLPLDLLVTDTYLYGFSGAYSQINYFKATLTFSFDPKRYFGVNLSFSDGRREDTGQREKLWSVSLTARY